MTKNQKIAMWVLVGLGAAGLTYGAYWFITRNNDQSEEFEMPEEQAENNKPSIPQTSSYPPRQGSSAKRFPLKKGSSGSLVRRLQQAIVNRWGRHMLPSGVDGVWGKETQSALSSKGMPTKILSMPMFETVISRIITPQKPNSSGAASTSSAANAGSTSAIKKPEDARWIANNIRKHTRDKSWADVRYWLSKIKSVNEYTMVNDFFKTRAVYNKIQSILEATFSVFRDPFFRSELTGLFKRIGLKKRAGKWHLSGFSSVLFNQIKTTAQTKVWNRKRESLFVPKETVLGEFISQKNGVTSFRTLDGNELFTATSNVQFV